MSGKELKKILEEGGYNITKVAELMGLVRQKLSQTLNKTSDVKTGTLEKMCQVLNIDMSFFYGGTEFLPNYIAKNKIEDNTNKDNRPIPKFMYDELKEEIKSEREKMQQEIYEYRDTIIKLENQISLMQRGYTIPEIAQIQKEEGVG